MAGKKSPKKGGKAKSPKKAAKEEDVKFPVEEEVKEEKDYSNLVNIPKHGWIKVEVRIIVHSLPISKLL